MSQIFLVIISCHPCSHVEVEPPDMLWGSFDESTGTWNGIVRQLQYKVRSGKPVLHTCILHKQVRIQLEEPTVPAACSYRIAVTAVLLEDGLQFKLQHVQLTI